MKQFILVVGTDIVTVDTWIIVEDGYIKSPNMIIPLFLMEDGYQIVETELPSNFNVVNFEYRNGQVVSKIPPRVELTQAQAIDLATQYSQSFSNQLQLISNFRTACSAIIDEITDGTIHNVSAEELTSLLPTKPTLD